MLNFRLTLGTLALVIAGGLAGVARGQTAYFVDGFHGGVWGHYPTNFTQYIDDSLREHPDWKLNLEIEPETWDFALSNTPAAYYKFQEYVREQSAGGRIEFINPDYAQSYLWNIQGESMIQQFARGMKKIRHHFPTATFNTYSSEEPCFTSALPGILESYGISNAVLKNPNTCWGGYTRAYGGELVNWIGPDGTVIRTVPRYGIESLKPGSTWETIGNANSREYIQAAFAAHIQHPVGMCIQDAGWRFGPWLQNVKTYYRPSESTLWKNYFENVASAKGALDWRFSQEDVLVGLVWGSQVLQRIAQEVRHAENHIVMAEKLATMAGAYDQAPWPEATLDEGWRTLLLSQHHDCWIVPYNGRANDTWADKVVKWTGGTCQRSDDVLNQSMETLTPAQPGGKSSFIRVFNTLGNARTETACVTLPADWQSGAVRICDAAGHAVPVQLEPAGDGARQAFFKASCPPMGYSTYRLEQAAGGAPSQGSTPAQSNGLVTVENDCYRMTLDATRGGAIQSLIAKQLGGRELVEAGNLRRFNEVRGFFHKPDRFLSSADQPAKVEVLENGPLRIRVAISGEIESNALTQVITLTQGDPRIDCSVRIDWQDKPLIGADFNPSGAIKHEDDRKEFYDDRYKLLVQFPLNLPHQQVYKDAPFDVTKSKLTDTFYDNWSGIKNNIILNWVDVFDDQQGVGVAMLTDHTTSYTHSTDHTVGLDVQFVGGGLWGRDYTVKGPTEIHYALLAHAQDWDKAGLWIKAKSWNEPLVTKVFQSDQPCSEPAKSLVRMEGDGWEIPSAHVADGKVYVRLFNPSAKASHKTIHYSGPVSKVELVQLNDKVIRQIAFRQKAGDAAFKLTLPQFGVGTLRITQ